MIKGHEYGRVSDRVLRRVRFEGETVEKKQRWGDNWRWHKQYTWQFVELTDGVNPQAADSMKSWESPPEELRPWAWWLNTVRVTRRLGITVAPNDWSGAYWNLDDSSVRALTRAIHSFGVESREVGQLPWPFHSHRRLFGKPFFRLDARQMEILHTIVSE